MKYRSICIYILFILSKLHVFAQGDKVLVGYSSTDTGMTWVDRMTILPENKIGFIHISTFGNCTVFVVDSIGTVLHKKELDNVGGYAIVSSLHIIEGGEKYILVGNASRDEKNYFVTFCLDSTLQNPVLLDTIELEYENRLTFFDVKFNQDKDVWETFGVVRQASNSSIVLDYFYVGINESHQFEKFKTFKTKYHPNFVLEFYWIGHVDRYLLSCFNQSTILVDNNFDYTYENSTKISYPYNGSTAFSSLKMYDCTDHENNIVSCYAKEGPNRPYNAAFVKLEVSADTVGLLEAIPLNAPPLGVQFESHMRKDLLGNYIISGTNTIPGHSGPSNIVKVVKYAPNYDKIWEFSYQDDKAFVIRDMAVDQSNDIVLVGDSWNMFGDGQFRGFLMKVYANGALTSYEEIPTDQQGKYNMRISPNPASHRLCLHTGGEAVQMVRFWDTKGQLALSERPTTALYCFDLPSDLPPGIYIVETLFADGYRNVQKLMVER